MERARPPSPNAVRVSMSPSSRNTATPHAAEAGLTGKASVLAASATSALLIAKKAVELCKRIRGTVQQGEFTRLLSPYEGSMTAWQFVRGDAVILCYFKVLNVPAEPLRRMPWIEAMEKYGSDKPDLRFGMEFAEITDLAKGHGFSVFDEAEYITGFAATGCAAYTRKQIDSLTEFVKRQQIGAKGLVWIRVAEDGVKSSIDKFYSPEEVRAMAERCGAVAGDMVFILCGKKFKTLTQLCALRLEVAQQLGLRDPQKFAPLWVVDFPLFEWSEEDQRFYAMHHPFTSPKPEDIPLLDSDTGAVRANAYDMVINGVEVGGGSIRIHDSKLQDKMFQLLGFTEEKAQERFGFLMNAFKYGAPPHGGLAYGLDRWVSLFAGLDSIRDCIAFPKNNSGRDVMLDAPGQLDDSQLEELCLKINNELI